MKSYNSVYNKGKAVALNEQKLAIENDHARLLAAIKKEYGVNDFSKLSESEKATYKTMLSEMWSSESGLTEKGVAFVNEASSTLTSVSTDEQIDAYIKKNLKPQIEKILQNMLVGRECKVLTVLKADVENLTKKKIAVGRMKNIVGALATDYLKSALRNLKF